MCFDLLVCELEQECEIFFWTTYVVTLIILFQEQVKSFFKFVLRCFVTNMSLVTVMVPVDAETDKVLSVVFTIFFGQSLMPSILLTLMIVQFLNYTVSVFWKT